MALSLMLIRFFILLEVSLKKSLECLAVSCFVAELFLGFEVGELGESFAVHNLGSF